jgi:hypothetical protein
MVPTTTAAAAAAAAPTGSVKVLRLWPLPAAISTSHLLLQQRRRSRRRKEVRQNVTVKRFVMRRNANAWVCWVLRKYDDDPPKNESHVHNLPSCCHLCVVFSFIQRPHYYCLIGLCSWWYNNHSIRFLSFYRILCIVLFVDAFLFRKQNFVPLYFYYIMCTWLTILVTYILHRMRCVGTHIGNVSLSIDSTVGKYVQQAASQLWTILPPITPSLFLFFFDTTNVNFQFTFVFLLIAAVEVVHLQRNT